MVVTKRRIARFSLVALGTLVAGAGAVAVTVALSLKRDLADFSRDIEARSQSGQQ